MNVEGYAFKQRAQADPERRACKMRKVIGLQPWNNAATICRNNRTQWNKLSLVEKIYVWLGIANSVKGRNEYRCGVV